MKNTLISSIKLSNNPIGKYDKENIITEKVKIDNQDDKENNDNLSFIFMDLSIDLNVRLKNLNLYYTLYGTDQTLEFINKLCMMYTLSKTTVIHQYLFMIVMKSQLSNMLKLLAAQELASSDKNNIGYKALDYICKIITTDSNIPLNKREIPTPCKINAICTLMKNTKYKKNANNYFCIIINDIFLECDFRYKCILSLEHKKINFFFIIESALSFINNSLNMTQYRILAGQLLIHKYNYQPQENIEEILLNFSQDNTLDYNLRADAADVLLQLGTEKNKLSAREIIMILGRENSKINTLYENAQNVHIKEIEQSVNEILEFLSSLSLNTPNNMPVTFEYIKSKIEKYITIQPCSDGTEKKYKKDDIDKINISLNRIYMDRALYSKYNCNLSNILIKVWTYINTHDCKNQMIIRLMDELIEMSGTCSSGYITRLINSITGFGEFSLKISFCDQIISNLNGRLNRNAKLIDNIYFQEKVLEEMSISANDYKSRSNFLKFFQENISIIREELYNEFKDYINDTDFDLFFRKAISHYTGDGSNI
jgi:hypothetical protein